MPWQSHSTPIPLNTGTSWMMGAFSAICALASADYTRVSAPSASCGRGRRPDLVLTTYGRSSGFCVDPVEKKALNHFLPESPVLSFGTSGCNLGCKFYQNWDISKAREYDVLAERAYPEDIARMAERLGCPSVAYTYNDPTIFHEYAIDTAITCHARVSKGTARPQREGHRFGTRMIFSDRRILASSRASRHASLKMTGLWVVKTWSRIAGSA